MAKDNKTKELDYRTELLDGGLESRVGSGQNGTLRQWWRKVDTLVEGVMLKNCA